MFDLNIYMLVESEKDFSELRKQIQVWKKRHSMFRHDVVHVEKVIETHIQNYSKFLVEYRQTRKKSCLEKAQNEINEINRLIQTVEKIELMSILSRG